MSWQEIFLEWKFWFSSIGMTGLLYVVVTFWFPALLKHGFDKRLETYKRELVIRDKASAIAEILSLEPRKDSVEKINRHLLELCLYLPPCMIHKLSHTLKGDKSQLDIGRFPLFLEIRDFIEGSYRADKTKKLSPDNIPQLVLGRVEETTQTGTPAKIQVVEEPVENR